MYVLLAGDSDPDYSRVYGPFNTAEEAYAQAPEDSDDTRWRALKIRPAAEIREDGDFPGDGDDTGEAAPEATGEDTRDEVPQLPLEGQMLALIRQHGGMHDIPAPDATVYAWSEFKLRGLGEYNAPLPDDLAELLFTKETLLQKAVRERLAAENDRERRTWRELRDAHKPVVAQPAAATAAAPKKPRKPSPAQLAKQARRELEQRVNALIQLHRGFEAIPAPNADVYAWVQAKLADMGEDGHPVSKGIADYYFGKPPHNTLSGRKLKQAQEALANNRAEWYPLRDKHTPKPE